MTEYPFDSTVTFEGKKWRVISIYFNLRKLQRVGAETYRTVTVETLNAQKPVHKEGGSNDNRT